MAIYVAGHQGMVGNAILRRLRAAGRQTITRTREELDLTDQYAVRHFMRDASPDAVILAAAKVGGIHANNTYPADFIAENLMIQTNVITAARDTDVKKLLFLGSSCIYPRSAPQPIPEEALLSGALEPTNEPYAIAKIAGIKLCESMTRQFGTDYRSVMPTNLYGPGDNFHPENAHVLPALIRRFHEAKMSQSEDVVVWGTGEARREFLHVDDMAAGALFLFDLDRDRYNREISPMISHVNIGTGRDISIAHLARLIAKIVRYDGALVFDTSRPDGTPRKLLNIDRITRLGWSPMVNLEQGIARTYAWFRENVDVGVNERGFVRSAV